MLGSYGLLGIFVYCEHKAGLTPPTNTHTDLFWLPVLLSVDRVKISGDIQTDLEARRSGWRRWLKRRWCGSLMERHSSLQGASINIIPITSNKTGMKSLPRSFCRFWFKHYCIFSFFDGFDEYQCCFYILFVLYGVVLHFHASGVPRFCICFIPQTFLCKRKSVIFVFFFSLLW